MGMSFTFPVDKFVEGNELKGFKEFDCYYDGAGRELRLTRLSDVLTNGEVTDGEALTFKADGTASNDVSAAALVNTVPRPAGVALGTIKQSTAVGEKVAGQKYIWVLARGAHPAVQTAGSGDIIAFATVVPDLVLDGKVKIFTPSGAFAAVENDTLARGVLGFATAAENVTDDTVPMFVDCS